MAFTSHLILPNAACPHFSRCMLTFLPAVSRPSRYRRRLALLPLRLSHPSLTATPFATAAAAAGSSNTAATSSHLQALIFDCDGVILESEHLHRQAYNDAFAHFAIRCSISSPKPLYWDSDFYDELQNRIGGGKPKMRWCYCFPLAIHFFLSPSHSFSKSKFLFIGTSRRMDGLLLHGI
ncbi:hypothetical protein KSP40_PGU006983 [Platanthera guangdongensis]|uniref:Uncharacterized protein n=1 Tax=Platanthera guangdongensis TaxID=2320717 RepID=A0ABR2N5Y0_9ASPA